MAALFKPLVRRRGLDHVFGVETVLLLVVGRTRCLRSSPALRFTYICPTTATRAPRFPWPVAQMSRSRAHQPQYDFLSGDPPPSTHHAGSRIPMRMSTQTFGDAQATDDNGNTSLRAQIHKLQYEIESLKQERELAAVRHDEDLRSAQARAEADYKRAQASESSSHVASSKHDALARELEQIKEQAAAQQNDLEKQVRSLQEKNASLGEDADEAKNETASQERQFKRDIVEMQAKVDAATKSAEEIRVDLESKTSTLNNAQSRLVESEAKVEELENNVLRLKAQSGDSDVLGVIKRELSEQVTHIQKMESENTDLRIEVKRLRKAHKAVEVVEEEKRQLEGKMRLLHDLRKELDEARLQQQILQDEKSSWMSYLENASNEDFNFDNPRALARAFMEERMEHASLVEQLGKVTPELAARDDTIQSLEDQLRAVQAELSAAKVSATSTSDSKSAQRLERQRKLAQKEVDYLRAQVKAYDDEQAEFAPEKHDAQKTARIVELESAVDAHRKELETLNAELSKLDGPNNNSTSAKTGSKRAHDGDDAAAAADERMGELRRKNKAMQAEIEKLSTSRKILKKDLEASRSQVETLKASSQRVLELRNNPTSQAHAIKTSTLERLRLENVELLAQLERLEENSDKAARSSSSAAAAALVPRATLDRLRADLADRDRQLADKDKFLKRHKDVFAAKALEFKQAVASLLGWDLTIMPNGRVRVASIFYSGRSSGGDGDDDDVEVPGSITFDGEKQTMKVSGGPRSAFAKEISDQIKFWVDGRNEIPCFLSALTMEFYERTTRAQKM